MNQDFDGSALRELWEPVVAGRGAGAPPADAIVAAGRRRVRGRRTAAVGGALVAVAAVPLAVTAIAAGPGGGRTTAPATAPDSTAPHGTPTRPTQPSTVPATTAAPPKTEAPATGTTTVTRLPAAEPLPTTPKLLAEGVLGGKKWTVSGIAAKGNNELTKNENCLNLLITDGGRERPAAAGDMLLYCGGTGRTFLSVDLAQEVSGGIGNLAVGTAPAYVTTVVVRVQGVADPVTVKTVPAPGAPGLAIYVFPAGIGNLPDFDFDEYDAHGQQVAHHDNHSNPPNLLDQPDG